MRRIDVDTVPPTPWRNGGGRTRELFAWPTAGDWRLRVSVADIDADGPFSPFPGVQRHFAVLSGAGVRLTWADRALALRPADAAIAFDGSEAPDCDLLHGPTRDLNLMLRGLPGRLLRADMAAAAPPATGWRALFCAGAAQLHGLGQGQDQMPDEAPLPLPPFSLLIDLPAAPALRLQRLDAAPAYWLCVDAVLSR